MKTKYWNKTAALYKEKLEKKGYFVKFNWVDPYCALYKDITVRGRAFRGYGREFSTPREAYEYLK